MSVELRVKEKSLAAEARMIRHEEKKAIKSAKWHREKQEVEEAGAFERVRKSLYEHRIDVVRFEARATNLARAYIKGTPYRAIERSTKDQAGYKRGRLMGRVQKLICKYHDKNVSAERLSAWFEA